MVGCQKTSGGEWEPELELEREQEQESDHGHDHEYGEPNSTRVRDLR